MRIAQLVTAGATFFDRKHQETDSAELAQFGTVVTFVWDGRTVSANGNPFPTREFAQRLADVDLLHVYGRDLPIALIRTSPVPYLTETLPPPSRFIFRRAPQPAKLLKVGGREGLPEAVLPTFFDRRPPRRAATETKVAGSVRTGSAATLRELTLARIERFRDDVRWELFDAPPSPEQFAGVDVWIDAALTDEERDGCVAEAVVTGTPVIATRTSLNEWRLDRGLAGLLVPPGDPNEVAHAIATVLFKPEQMGEKLAHAATVAERYRPAVRGRALLSLYRSVLTVTN